MSINSSRKLISFSGIDGSGKTAIIDELSSNLRIEGKKVRVVWLRYNHYLTKIALAFGRLFGYTVFENYPDCRVSYHEFYRSKLLTHLFIWLTLLDTALATFFIIYLPMRFSNCIVICDRWIPDILVDLEIDTHRELHGNHIYSNFFWALVPDSATLMVVHRDYDEIRNARPEHYYDKNLKRRYELYRALPGEKNLALIDNTGSLDDAIRQAFDCVGRNTN
jgi:hypothetical protein